MYGTLIHSTSATWRPVTLSFVSANASEHAAVSNPPSAIARSNDRLGAALARACRTTAGSGEALTRVLLRSAVLRLDETSRPRPPSQEASQRGYSAPHPRV